MVKDPLDGGRTFEMNFETPVPTPEEPPQFTPVADEKVAAALAKIKGRPFSERHPELGKMINCQVCGTRHRQNERKCGQRFTFVIDGFEVYREDAQGNLVPDLRTATPEGEQPTRNQVIGAPLRQNFAKPRYRPHPSKFKLQLVERTRAIFLKKGFELPEDPSKLNDDERAAFEMNLKASKKIAARQLREEHNARSKRRRQQRRSLRQVNR